MRLNNFLHNRCMQKSRDGTATECRQALEVMFDIETEVETDGS